MKEKMKVERLGCNNILSEMEQLQVLGGGIGVDIHLLGSLSLCIDYDVRFGLWGHNKSELRFTDGPIVGHVVGIDERNLRSCISVGMKLDIPVKPISEMDRNAPVRDKIRTMRVD